jgi:hypothetical protein
MGERQAPEGVGLCLDRRNVSTAVMEPGRKVLHHHLIIGMGQRLGQGQRLLAPLHGLASDSPGITA